MLKDITMVSYCGGRRLSLKIIFWKMCDNEMVNGSAPSDKSNLRRRRRLEESRNMGS